MKINGKYYLIFINTAVYEISNTKLFYTYQLQIIVTLYQSLLLAPKVNVDINITCS